jgi:uncharacterized protein YecE (DUF72 family)
MKPGKIFIGTSGWNYKHWEGTFYPEELKQNQHFQYYQEHFDTVELNNSFYHLPPPETFKHWKEQTPKNFLFAVKASRYITHMKKLKDTKEALSTFLKNARSLGKKLGPVLFQLPPGWKLNEERLQIFLKQLPASRRFTFEFRNRTWYTDSVYELLKKYNCAFCIYELAGHRSPLVTTADFVYVRLHGPGAKYQGSYTTASLKKWAGMMQEWSRQGKDAYLYFDNDQAGYAAFNALTIKKLAENIYK